MAYERLNLANGITFNASHVKHLEDGIAAAHEAAASATGGSGPIGYVESLDKSNMKNLRDLATGSYVLYGYFKPYAGAPNTLTIDTQLINVVNKTAGSHILIFSTLNSMVNFLEIMVDSSNERGFTYTRTDIDMLDLHALIEKVGDLNGLNTEEKGSLVAAINEVAAAQGSGGNVEPMEDDIPKVFFGGALPQTKDDTIMSFRYISKTKDISGYCKTKAQGNSSMAHPKKNQTVKLYTDAECTEKLKVNFKGWGDQNKFCFKANWIDLTHARNVVSARLWGDVVKSRANYAQIPELLRTSPNHGAVDGFPVKVYADGVYQGRYTLNIPKDAWMANMDDELDNHCILCGENYVSGCFRAEANIDESDWTDEVHDIVPASIKTRWNEAIRFVMNSTDEEFVTGIGTYFDVESLIDYYLYGVIICNNDGFGKNQLFFTYDGQKWIASAYDVDNTFGLYLGGLLAVDFDRTAYEDYKNGGGNLLYVRLESLFVEAIKARYAELKNGALSLTNIINRFERFTDIVPVELVKEDYAETTADGLFTDIPLKENSNIQQIRNYIAKRYIYVDGYIDGLGSTPDESSIVWNPGYYVNGSDGNLYDSNKDAASDFIDLNGATKMLIFATDKVNWVEANARAAFYDADKVYINSFSQYNLCDENCDIPEGAKYVRFNSSNEFYNYFCFVTDVYTDGFVKLPSYKFVSSKVPSADGVVDAGNTVGYFDESIIVSPGDVFYWHNAYKVLGTEGATVYNDKALYGFDADGNFVSKINIIAGYAMGATIYVIPDNIASVKVGAHNTAKELISYKIVK